ncbi:Sodium/potassium/calcium exchanger 1 [Hondaea fermentalgiana]|uniref:Sodium/potassium/calcium exchanger 1 n=1 Tax=Hondaea fermentalgiana TaxID=2315210 RepID=A0A2R5GSQ7_9STRA|nr:Sodium/potassium/calcium exchanger 1 [Hondaea fermentalgiana]|eukprot:GBG31683.1 Sodium/potassium/calcium exchanger 1 [Hondaea fermentalgiana]
MKRPRTGARSLPWAASSVASLGVAWLALWPASTQAQDAITLDNATLVDDDVDCESGVLGPLLYGVVVEPKGIIFFVLVFLCYLMWAMTFVVERVLLPGVHLGLAQSLRLPVSVTSPAILVLGGCSVPIFFLNVLSMSRTESSAVGVGLALGSAALNFFVVLPVCYFTGVDQGDMYLYWWSLVRDLSVYIVGLGILAAFWFVQASPWDASVTTRDQACWLGQETLCCYQGLFDSPERLAPISYGVLMWWEGVCMIALYGLYLVLMRHQHRVKWTADSAFRRFAVLFCAAGRLENLENKRNKARSDENALYNESTRAAAVGKVVNKENTSSSQSLDVLKLLTRSSPIDGSPRMKRATIIIAMRKGNALTFFQKVRNGERSVTRKEVSSMLAQFVALFDRDIIGDEYNLFSSEEVSEENDRTLAEIVKSITDIGGSDDGAGLQKWLRVTEAQLHHEMNAAFDILAAESSDLSLADATKLESLLQLIGCQPSKRVVRKTRDKLEIRANSLIGRQEFSEWYRACMAWSPHARGDAFAAMRKSPGIIEKVRDSLRRGQATDMTMVAHTGGGMGSSTPVSLDVWARPVGTAAPGVHIWRPAHGQEDASCMERFVHSLGVPFRLPVYMTTVFITGQAENLGFYGGLLWLVMSVFWLGLLSWGVLFASETISLTLNVPPASLGSTILALGLNAPHLISSVLRASASKGDAGSSVARSLELSVKGNVFDLLVSLPLAWLFANAARGHPTHVGASNIGTSLLVLCSFVVLLLVLLTSARWCVDAKVALVMMALYILFLIQDVILADWAKAVPSYIYCSGCADDMVCASV